MKSLMTVKEAAQYLKLNYMTVYKLAQKGKIPASKVGGNWRFKREIIDKWLAGQSSPRSRTVLVVDDDSRVRDILVDIISERGHEVITVDSGEKAIEELEKHSFGLVFLDLVLPDISGVDVLRTIKESARKVPTVIITGYGDDPIAFEAMSLGPLLLIRKPFRVSDVVEVMDLVLGARR